MPFSKKEKCELERSRNGNEPEISAKPELMEELRRTYSRVLSEPIPARLVALVEQIRNRDAEGKSFD